MNGRTATARYIAGEERLSIPEPAERWPSAWGHGEVAFSRSFAADAARRLPEFTGYRLADMDAAGIDVQGLSHTVPGLLGGQRRGQRRTTGYSSERGTRRRRSGGDEAVRRVTAAGRHGPRLRWRPRPGNLTGRRGAALVPPILLAAGLNAAAVAGLAYIAGFRAVYTSLIRSQWPWLCAVPAALAMSAAGYYLAYRSVYAAEGDY